MILSDLLGSAVIGADGGRLGWVTDVRFELEPDLEGVPDEAALVGFIISPRTKSSSFGYERSQVNAPFVIARLLEWRHRGSFLVNWADVAAIGQKRLLLRAGYTAHDPAL